MVRDIYINSNLNPFTKFTSSNRGTEYKDILSMEHFSNDYEGYYTMKWDILFEFDGKSMETETST